jgi:hypothetical protein
MKATMRRRAIFRRVSSARIIIYINLLEIKD